MAKRNRVAWGMAAVLAVVVVGGVGLLGARLRPYWVAKFHGSERPSGEFGLLHL